MSIFDDVNAQAATTQPPSAADLLASDASAGAAGASAGLTTISPNGVGGMTVNDGLGHITQVSANNLGGFTTNDGHGHANVWMSNHVGGLYLP